MRRFLIPPELITGNVIPLTGEIYRHMVTVLRLKPGDGVILCNGAGTDFFATIQETSAGALSLEITGSRSSTGFSDSPSLTLIQGLPKGDKFDLIIQKATELGIASIIAFPAAHSVVRISDELAENRIKRWKKIAAEASRQSERSSIPAIKLAGNLDTALHSADEPVKLFFHERDRSSRLREVLAGTERPSGIALLVGPEGGFSREESAIAATHGFRPVSLGPRILRAETAVLAAIAIIQYECGDMR